MFSTLGIVGVVAVCAAIFLYNRPITKRMRLAAPGEFVTLGKGVVHYQWHGNQNGPVLVMVHGLTTPSFVWDEMLPTLIEQGYRVLTFDHYGRGFSDRPRGNQNLDFFVDEIDQLFGALKVDQPVYIVGYSMGGWIATAYAARRPDKVCKLALIAPVGLGFEIGRAGRFMADWPVLGDILTFCFAGHTIRKGAKKAGTDEGIDPRTVELQCRETYYSGFTTAVLSSIRNMHSTSSEPDHRILADTGLPLLAIYAQDDSTIPVVGAERLLDINHSAEVVVVEDVGHSLAITRGAEVSAMIHRFLKATD